MVNHALVRCEDLAKAFAHHAYTVWALKEINLTFFPGEFVCVTGRSGSGKSTLLHCIGTLEKPTHGKIWIDEKSVELLEENKLLGIRRKFLGFVFQQCFLFSYLSALDNVAIPLVYRGISWKVARQKAQGLLEEVGLSRRIQQSANWLSGGEAQRVALVRAVIHEPKMLLADEPTGELDSMTSSQISELLEKQREKGVTILAASHDPRIQEKATRIIHLEDGKIL